MATQTISAEHPTNAVVPNNRSLIWNDVIQHFAAVSGRSPDEIRQEIIQMGGNMVITDKEAKAIFARLEAQYQRDDFFSVVDLCPSFSTNDEPSTGTPRKTSGGCVDAAEDTSVCDLVEIIAVKLGLSAIL